VVKVNHTDYPSLLGDFINKNMANILVLKDGRTTMEPRGQIVARIVSDESLRILPKLGNLYLIRQRRSLRHQEDSV